MTESKPSAGPAARRFASALRIEKIPDPQAIQLKHAVVIHNQTVEAVKNFDKYFVNAQLIMENTGNPIQGADDLLRALLLFACSGLDAVVKQLVQDSLEFILRHDDGAQNEFQKFVERRLKRATVEEGDRLTVGNSSVDSKLLAGLMVSFDPRSQLVAMLTRHLTSNSLQSRDQLLKVAAHFALGQQDVMENPQITKQAFDARNQIAHEMDVDLSSGDARRSRSYKSMIDWCDNILLVSSKFIHAVESKIQECSPNEEAEPVFPIDLSGDFPQNDGVRPDSDSSRQSATYIARWVNRKACPAILYLSHRTATIGFQGAPSLTAPYPSQMLAVR